MDQVGLEAEHERLREMADRLFLQASANSDLVNEKRTRKFLLADLQAFAAALEKHFAREEEGGYFSWIVAERPGLAVQVDSLHRQHAEILARFARLLRDAPRLSDVRTRARGLLLAFRGHESAENDMVQRAVMEDIGGVG